MKEEESEEKEFLLRRAAGLLADFPTVIDARESSLICSCEAYRRNVPHVLSFFFSSFLTSLSNSIKTKENKFARFSMIGVGLLGASSV